MAGVLPKENTFLLGEIREAVWELRLIHAVDKAKRCPHPEAQALVALFPCGVPIDLDACRELVIRDTPNMHPVVLFLRAVLLHSCDTLERAARAGSVMAQMIYLGSLSGPPWYEMVQMAAAGKDTGAMITASLGRAIDQGAHIVDGKMLREAAELGDPEACSWYSKYAQKRNCTDWVSWLCKSTAWPCGAINFCKQLYHYTRRLRRNLGTAGMPDEPLTCQVVFELGEAIFNTPICGIGGSLDATEASLFAIDFYRRGHQRARQAILYWMLASKQLGVVKDIRIMIGKMTWQDKKQWAFIPLGLQ